MNRLRVRDPAVGDVVRARLDALLNDLGSGEVAGAEWAPEADAPVPTIGAAPADRPRALHGQEADSSAARPSTAGPARVANLGGRRARASSAARGRREDAPPDSALPGRVVAFTRRHVAVIATVGLLGLGATVWGITQARAVPVEAPVPVPIAAASASASPSPTPAPQIRVHVVGAVRAPGVVSLPEGARVEDALAAAGGLAEGARPGELNLAQVVADGAQIAVGDAAAPGGEVRGDGGSPAAGGAVTAAGAGSQVDLNRATAEQLEALPGVGPVTASSILAWRSAHGKFSRVEELQEVDGIGAKTLEKLAPLVRV